MNKIITLISLASAFSVMANNTDFEALKKSNAENKKQATAELNKALYDCLRMSERLSMGLASYAEVAMEKKPDGDLLKDEIFVTLLARHNDLNEACRQKTSAMARLNQLSEIKVNF